MTFSSAARATDAFAGASGIDTVRYETSSSGVHIDLTLGTGSGGDAAGDSFSSIETVIGSRFDDMLIGDGAATRCQAAAARTFWTVATAMTCWMAAKATMR